MIERRDFELYLMSLMRGRRQVDAALASIGIARHAFEDAARRTAASLGFLELVARPFDEYRRILGTPLETTPEPGIAEDSGFAGSLRHRFHLELWPGFDLILRAHREGWAWGPELVRRRGEPVPALRDMFDLRSWTVVASEVVARFGLPRSSDVWNFGKDTTYAIERDGAVTEVTLVFDLELLQRIELPGREGDSGTGTADDTDRI